MSFATQNMSNYTIHQENEALKVVSHLNEMSIIDIVKQDFMQRYDFSLVLPINNLPSIIEQTFKQTEDTYPESVQDLENRKNELYRVILDNVAQLCNVVFDEVDDSSLYSFTYYAYDFLISNFKPYLISFFTNFIIKEKNNIYINMNLSMYKKEKNSSTKYGKSMYTNTKLAIISAYLDLVINNMSTFDIDLETILSNVYPNNSIITLLGNIHPINNFYTDNYISLVNTPLLRQSIVSNIRFALHNAAIN
jgi:hypothetical protein